MHTCSGEKVFVGNASAISFLQFLRGSLSNILGSNGFTISHNGHRMFEAQVPLQQPDGFQDDMSDEEKLELIQLFSDASSGLLDLFDKSEIDTLVDATHPREKSVSSSSTGFATDIEGRVCLYMMIAIGAQCRGRPEDMPKAFQYFSQARTLSFHGFLTDLTLNMARGFVLMAFYMFGACRRNAAFMYLGVATKAASVLGLHMSDQFQSLSEAERSLRSRIDRSIRLFDVVCSSILGRPTSSLPRRSNGGSSTTPVAANHRSQSVAAACHFSPIMNRIVEKLTDKGYLGLEVAEDFLEEIRDWSSNLPLALRQGLRHASARSRPSSDRETTIGNIHVACAYYFGIITTTREYLIQHIMPQIDGRVEAGVVTDGCLSSEDNEKTAELAKVCVDAAAYMAEMCSDALDTGVIMGNMCILKAWLFAAGLILGFSLLDQDTGPNNRAAFRNTLRVLEFLGRLSPQAGQYHRVLTSFSHALETYRNHSAHGRDKTAAPYVERLLSINKSSSPESSRHDAGTRIHARDHNYNMHAGATVATENLLTSQLDLGTLDFGGEDLILSLLWEDDNGLGLDGTMAIY
ncbi:Filamentous growth regulator 27 [Colletotrichum fructicola]|uniref:C6 transcription factor n=1 Tax=Colletotrichum fructicola (strain Nara gc5) TaxID=1213859 RepID=L2FA25_COLFN|nr:Filamentous growth regulator 27 [Colletotrichum fructicola]KAF4475914.1 Filamentous growth regulator 27 [Colletotrichum fructicola Nara gc5]KAF4882042.1 Filamentous growth regulator 27 [Colletotrichum fructicola]KAF4900981.1 Filamentous growth regulator 27 [Colletotrichum fructicola]KAF4934320.1 Filamentous growth regulator 27 [Colletotrichum fructicola]